MSTGVSETVTAEELKENRVFIDAIMETDVMKVQYLWENPSIISKQTTHRYYTAAVYTPGCLRICWQTLVRIWNLCEGNFLENQALAIMSQSAIDVFHYVTPLYNYAVTAQISHLALQSLILFSIITISSEKCCWLTKPSQNKVSFVAFRLACRKIFLSMFAQLSWSCIALPTKTTAIIIICYRERR